MHSCKADCRGLWLPNMFSVTKDIDVTASGDTSSKDLNNISNFLDIVICCHCKSSRLMSFKLSQCPFFWHGDLWHKLSGCECLDLWQAVCIPQTHPPRFFHHTRTHTYMHTALCLSSLNNPFVVRIHNTGGGWRYLKGQSQSKSKLAKSFKWMQIPSGLSESTSWQRITWTLILRNPDWICLP